MEDLRPQPREDRCPACHSSNFEALESIATADIVNLYRQSLNIDVANYFYGHPQIALQRCIDCDLRFFLPFCAGDAALYEQLQVYDWYYEDDKAEFGFASQFVETGHRVLEVGCGSGAFRSRLPSVLHYTGLEFSDAAILKARQRGLNPTKQSVEEHALLSPQSYDIVCAFQVAEHIPDIKSFIAACTSALKPGGKLIITVPAEDSFLSISSNTPLNMPPHHVLRWTDRALGSLAEREGLQILQLWHEPLSSDHQDWHARVMARHYINMMGLGRPGLIVRGLRHKAAGLLLRSRPIKARLAAAASKAFPHAEHGHTVAMVATAA